MAEACLKQFPLNEGSHLFTANLGNVLVGCPPEILKVLMQKHLPMPDTIVIPSNVLQQNSSLASLEFPFYHFLFIQQGLAQGRKFRVLAEKKLCKKLENMLRVTLLGPEVEEALEAERKLSIAPLMERERLEQVKAEANFLALKNQSGKILEIKDLIQFVPFETGDTYLLYDGLDGELPVSIRRKGDNDFEVMCKEIYPCSLELTKPLTPPYEIKMEDPKSIEKLSKNGFTVRLLGCSEGFDPNQPANGILIRLNGKWILWDSPAFLRDHLAAVGVDFKDIDALFVSHVHEDHVDVAQTLQKGKRTPIYTTPDIYHSLLLKSMAILNCGYKEAASHYNYHPIYPRKPFDLFGAKAEVFNSLHAIPALGLRLEAKSKEGVKRLYITGDTLPQRMVDVLKEGNALSPNRLKEIDELNPAKDNYDLIMVDAGSGIIHGDPADFHDNPNHVNYMHTGKNVGEVPKHHSQEKPGHLFELHS